MKRNIRFRKMWNSFVTLTIWEMESPVISWIFTVPEIMKENFQSCLTCTEAVFSLEKRRGIFLPSYIYGKHWKKSSFYPYINETCSDADNRIIKTKDALCFSGSGQFLLHS